MKKKVVSGIYIIKSPTGRAYIGQSTNIYERWSKAYNNTGVKHQPAISNSLTKYGKDSHSFEILEECLMEKLDEREMYHKEEFVKEYGWKMALFCKLDDKGPLERMKVKIMQYDLQGNYIKTFDSYADASREFTGSRNSSQIHHAALNERGCVTAHGYQWRFGDDRWFKVTAVKRRNPVKQLTLEGQLIKVWDDVYHAAKEGGFSYDCIRRVCIGNSKHHHGYKFEYDGRKG